MLYRTNCSSEDYSAYISTLTACGYTYHDGRTAGNVTSSTYYSDSEILNVSFTPTDNTLRVCADPRTEAALQPLTATPYNGRTDIEPLFIQVGDTLSSASRGMSYVIRLCDGTFVVVDGGGSQNASVAMGLINILKDYNKLKGVPVVSCWIFTSGDYYHNSAFINSIHNDHRDKIDLKSVLFSFPSEEQAKKQATSESNARFLQSGFRQRVNNFHDGTVFYKARTGQVLHFAGCEIEVLFTFEDHAQPKDLAYFNDAPIVFRLSLSDGTTTQSVLMLGDSHEDVAKILEQRYGNYLRSDAIQIAQRGSKGGTEAFYDAVGAGVVFWACKTSNFTKTNWATATRDMLGKSYAKVLYAACKGNSAVNLTQIKNRSIIADHAPCMNAADRPI